RRLRSRPPCRETTRLSRKRGRLAFAADSPAQAHRAAEPSAKSALPVSARSYRAAWLAPAEHGVAHAVEEASLLLFLLTAAELRLQFFDPRVGALERLVLDEGGLHQRIDGMGRTAKSVRDQPFGLRVTRGIFQTRQAGEQFVD